MGAAQRPAHRHPVAADDRRLELEGEVGQPRVALAVVGLERLEPAQHLRRAAVVHHHVGMEDGVEQPEIRGVARLV